MNPREINMLRSLESDSTTSDDEILVSFGVGPVVYLKDLLSNPNRKMIGTSRGSIIYRTEFDSFTALDADGWAAIVIELIPGMANNSVIRSATVRRSAVKHCLLTLLFKIAHMHSTFWRVPVARDHVIDAFLYNIAGAGGVNVVDNHIFNFKFDQASNTIFKTVEEIECSLITKE